MNIVKKDLPKKQIELLFELTSEELKPFVETAAQEISAEKKIKGFRPGKAPYQMVINEVGEMAIYQRASNLAITKTYFDYIEKENIEVIDQPSIDVLKLAPGNPFEYKATVSLIPQIEMCDFEKIKIAALPAIKVEDKDIEKTIADLLRMRATQVLTDAASKKGDMIDVDFDTYIDSVPIENGSAKKHNLIIGEGYMIPGFEENLIGLKKDEEKEFELTFPEKYHEKSLVNKKAKFKIKVNAVYDVQLPKMDDEFAKGLGLKDAESLKKHITANIEREKQVQAEQKQELEIINSLIEKSKFEDIPEVLINQEAHKMVHEMEDNIARQGMDFQNYLQHIKKTEADLKLDFVPDAIKRVKTALFMRAFAKKENIEATEKEVHEELDRTLASYKLNPNYAAEIGRIEENLKTENAYHYFANLIANRKTMNRLKELLVK
ncbi:MAG: Trigger factor [Parcubacteria group bacterium GW2011_GWC2_39_14]|nr:MAG: Trigger factor [Parcubacteria group bacterium GW2011_GWC2_39_14]KKR53428.1 MAG: Trigger factor [Parcubacteria group bacterium GW2011_GWA2_40_23]